MSDLYTQVVNSPPGRMIAGRVGLPQPTQLERHEPGAPVVAGAVLSGGAPRGRLGKRIEQAAGRRSARAKPETSDCPGQGARLRRHRHRRLDRAGRAAALLPPQREAGAALRPRRRARHAPGRPAAAGGDRAAGPGGLHPLARQGDRPRHRRAAGLRRRGRRGGDRLDPALPALAPLGLRLRPGDRGRQGGDEDARGRLGAPARRQGGAGHRRLARHRRGDRHHPAPRRRRARPARRAGALRRPRPRSPRGSAPRRSSSTSPTPTRRCRSPRRSPTAST